MMILYLVKFAYSLICYARSAILLSCTNKLICNKRKCIVLCFVAILCRKLLGLLRYEVVNDKKKKDRKKERNEQRDH